MVKNVETKVDLTTELIKEVERIASTEGNLSVEDEIKLIEIYKLSGDIRLGADVMFMKQYNSIVKICKQFAFKHKKEQDIDDYINSCYEYMLEALDTFKYSARVRFNTYLSVILKKCLNDNYYKENGISKYYQQEYYKIGTFINDYAIKTGRKPTDQEIMDALGYTENRYSAIANEVLALNPFHIEEFQDALKNETRESEHIVIEDLFFGMNRALRVDSPETILVNEELSNALAKVLEELGPERADILKRFAGVGYKKPQSKRKICEETGLSKTTVNRLLSLILDYAREELRAYYYD